MLRRRVSRISPITAVQARMKTWGWTYSNDTVDGHLQTIYKNIETSCKGLKTVLRYYHTDGDEVQKRICKVLREGGYDVICGYNRKKSRWEIEINW